MKRDDGTRAGATRGTAAVLLAVFFVGCQGGGASKMERKPAVVNPVERGKYLVTIAGCNDCHTPLKMGDQGSVPDRSKLLSGHPQGLRMPIPPKLPPGPWTILMAGTSTAFAGPWGITYAPNLTPDSATGLGTWSEAKFVKDMRSGRLSDDNRPIMPPMPWQSLASMSDEDLKAVYAYLRSIPPINNAVPEYVPPSRKGK